MEIIRSIQERIYELRGERVMLDRDLADLYEVPVKILNQAVKRNLERFPKDFMFQLTQGEQDALALQNQALEEYGQSLQPLRLQIATLKKGRGQHSKYLPYAFTEQGIAMLSGVLHSSRAIQMNIAIMRAFVEIRRIMLQESDIKTQLKAIQQKISEHDVQLSAIYDAIENLLDENAAKRKWENRERIGF